MILAAISGSCVKEKPSIPSLTTMDVTEIGINSVTTGGIISSDGGAPILSSGMCWGQNPGLTIADSKTTDGTTSGSFTTHITNLKEGSAYYVKAYAINSVGIAYADSKEFRTLGKIPIAITDDALKTDTIGGTLTGEVHPNFLVTTVTFEYGLNTAYGTTVTAAESPIIGNQYINVSAELTGLTSGTIYHFRVISSNSLGTVYGDDRTFTTLGHSPDASTLSPSSIYSYGATLNGLVNPYYLRTTVVFEYGTSTAYGQSLIALQSPLTGVNDHAVSTDLSGLISGTIYHYRTKATNSLGSTYGADKQFRTL